jgi:serine phosphatase RsbU (regulator of sigma subunit)
MYSNILNYLSIFFSDNSRKTLRFRILLAFVLFFVITIALIILTVWFDREENQIDRIIANLHKINIKVKEINSLEKDFISYEAINPAFYTTDKSVYIAKHKEMLKKLNADLDVLQENGHRISKDIEKQVDSVKLALDVYEATFDSLISLIQTRGFGDYGLEGEMRTLIHKLEEPLYRIDQIKLLDIRRYEKDYIIRKETAYAQKVRQLVIALQSEITARPVSPENLIAEETLQNYFNIFLEFVRTDEKIGFHNNSGLRRELSHISNRISRRIQIIDTIILKKAEIANTKVKVVLSAIIFLSILLNILSVYFVVKRLASPIIQLSGSIHNTIRNNFAPESQITEIRTQDEIGMLSQDLNLMLSRVQERTAEVVQQKEQIEKKNRNITNSINYAKRIQHAILPHLEQLNQSVNDYFILFKPRDIVSGDFYWFSNVGNRTIIVAADCTGHGVPGAFMSMVGCTYLNQIVHLQGVSSPEKILYHLNLNIKRELKQDNKENRDGMDVAICVIDKEKQVVEFAGAKNPLVYIQDGEIFEIDGDKLPVGGTIQDRNRAYTKHIVSYASHNHSPSFFYMFSDGYPDQFGGEEGRKFMKKRLKELIFNITLEHQQMRKQKEILDQTMQTWMGKNHEQIDDILILGFKLCP